MREFHDGRKDGLEPLESLDVDGAQDLGQLLDGMSRTAFGGRALGEALGVLRQMADDPDCVIVLTLSGAMTIAKMGRLICEMIDRGLAHIIVSTGALMAHGLSESIGGVHYKHDPKHSDQQLFEWGYNRVYDTLEMESNLDDGERLICSVLDEAGTDQPTSSYLINQAIGERLCREGLTPSILGNAFRKDVPVFVPAFTDSEVGLNVSLHAMLSARNSSQQDPSTSFEQLLERMPHFNPFLDLHEYTRRLLKAKRLGIFTVGGGVPRNWAQQAAPFVDVAARRLKLEIEPPRFRYGIRICPEPVHWGGLSGCTYSEGVSWGKFLSPQEGGRFAEVLCDATIAWPILIKAYLEDSPPNPK